MAKANEKRGRNDQAGSRTVSSRATAHEPGLLYSGSAITAGMALAEPSLQEFLAEPDLHLQLFDTPNLNGMQTPYWPELWGDGWTAG